MSHLARLFAILLAGSTLVVSAPAAAAQHAQTQTLVGDGMTVVVHERSVDARTVRGTMRLPTSQAWPFEARLAPSAQGGSEGVGEVRAGNRRVAFRVAVDAAGAVRILLGGKTYTLGAQRPKATPRGHAAATIRLEPHTINDRTELAYEITSHTAYVPQGWQLEGGTFHLPSRQYWQVIPSLHLAIHAPDGREVRILPQVAAVDRQIRGRRAAEGAALEGLVAARLLTSHRAIGAYMRDSIIPMAWQGASDIQIRNVVRLPEYRTLLNRHMAPVYQQVRHEQSIANQFNSPVRWLADCDVVAIEAEFTHQGRRFEVLRILSMAWAGKRAGQDHSIGWRSLYDVCYKAPKGELQENLGLLRTLSDSVRGTPVWNQAMARRAQIIGQTHANIRADSLRTIRRISQIHAQTSAEVRQIISQGHANRVAIQDATHAKVIRAIRETNLVTPPGSSGPIEVSMHWDKVYSNGNALILSADPTYDPGPGWQVLQPKN
ncbi:MAG: hypothetical protein GY946_21430 [bacterium]|nr:hypothetical protein [bacterium]